MAANNWSGITSTSITLGNTTGITTSNPGSSEKFSALLQSAVGAVSAVSPNATSFVPGNSILSAAVGGGAGGLDAAGTGLGGLGTGTVGTGGIGANAFSTPTGTANTQYGPQTLFQQSLYLLGLQMQLQQVSQAVTMLSNIEKKKYDTYTSMIQNIR